jgi:hypothetical protein
MQCVAHRALRSIIPGRDGVEKRKSSWLCIFAAAGILLAAGAAACSGDQIITVSTPEPAVPADYITYTSKPGLFSISYPPGWEVKQSSLLDMEQAAKDYIDDIAANLTLADVSVLFFASREAATGNLTLNIVIEPVSPNVLTHDQLVEAELKGIRQVAEDYVQVSRTKTTVDGREATVIDHEYTLPNATRVHLLQMIILVDRVAWIVTCAAPPDEFAGHEPEFQSIVRTLRITG